MRVSKNRINKHLEKELFTTLHELIADLKTPEEIGLLLEAFLSKSEHETMAKRLAIAYWLDKGRGYNNIRTNLKVSSATVASVQETMKKHKGARLALQHIKADEWAKVWAERIKKFTKRLS
ncbi:MAG: hypothetical protein HYU80_00875 [Candidatus Blackburnbacteria bacterium]|nr:hypothetical protein [Candidatus Blackburnbacteria bacterium]